MPIPMRIKRFSLLDRVFHFFLMLTFLVQTVTGFSRTLTPPFGERNFLIFLADMRIRFWYINGWGP